jgi:hypothetical protein
MTTKKGSTKKQSSKRRTVKDRARAIVSDAQGYDEETRHAIKNSLDENDSNLAELVRRAESGETILDVSAPLGGVPSKVDARGGLYDARGNDHNPLTRETARELLHRLHGALVEDGDTEPCADFLLLLYALANEKGARERWIIYDDARELFARMAAPKVDDVIDDALAEALGRLKGSRQQ